MSNLPTPDTPLPRLHLATTCGGKTQASTTYHVRRSCTTVPERKLLCQLWVARPQRSRSEVHGLAAHPRRPGLRAASTWSSSASQRRDFHVSHGAQHVQAWCVCGPLTGPGEIRGRQTLGGERGDAHCGLSLCVDPVARCAASRARDERLPATLRRSASAPRRGPRPRRELA